MRVIEKIQQVVGRSKTCATLVLMREMGGKRWRRITRLMPDKRLTKIQNSTIFQNFFWSCTCDHG